MRQVFWRQLLAAGDDVSVLHDVSQLADIARPIVLQKHIDGLGCQQLFDLFNRSPSSPTEQVPSQRGNVRAPLAQSRQANLKCVDAEVQVLAELIVLDQG